jgi:hypothetical protein
MTKAMRIDTITLDTWQRFEPRAEQQAEFDRVGDQIDWLLATDAFRISFAFMFDGVPLVMGGLFQAQRLNEPDMGWALVSKHAGSRDLLHVLAFTKKFLIACCGNVEATVLPGFEAGARTLAKLGFQATGRKAQRGLENGYDLWKYGVSQ